VALSLKTQPALVKDLEKSSFSAKAVSVPVGCKETPPPPPESCRGGVAAVGFIIAVYCVWNCNNPFRVCCRKPRTMQHSHRMIGL
jgi:hypothetical protein